MLVLLFFSATSGRDKGTLTGFLRNRGPLCRVNSLAAGSHAVLQPVHEILRAAFARDVKRCLAVVADPADVAAPFEEIGRSGQNPAPHNDLMRHSQLESCPDGACPAYASCALAL